MIKAAVIGLGRMGVSHFAIANMHPEVEVIALCEPSGFITSAIEKHTSITCYKDYQKMIEAIDLDCIFITTPTKYHFEMVKYSLESGLHVFVEKPFCLNSEDGKVLADLASGRGLVNQVGYHNRFIGTFTEAKRLIESGAVGTPYHCVGEAYGPVVTKPPGNTWRSNSTEGGGCLYDYATHVINLMQFVVGTPIAVSGTVLKSIFSKNVDDAVYGTLHLPDNATAQLSINWSESTYRKMSTQLTIYTKTGKIIVDAQELKVFFGSSPPEGFEQGWNMRWVTDLSPNVGFYLRGEEYSAQIEHFIDSIKGRTSDNINSFETANTTDYIVELLISDAQRVGI